MPSISMDDVFARSAGHEAGGRFERRVNLFTDHQFGLAAGATAATHQLHHPKRNDAICFKRQQHQRIDHSPVPLNSQDDRAEIVPARKCKETAARDRASSDHSMMP
jgi:hypothetical protein